MKKTLLLIIIFFINITIINAQEKFEVKLDRCVDGDTAWFILENKAIKVRFLAINAPENTTKKEVYGDVSSIFTCNKLENANKIEIEYDDNSEKTDKYERHLVWVFVDNILLQKLIVEEGLAKVDYLYEDYKYTDIVLDSQNLAIKDKKHIWNQTDIDYTYVILFFIIVILGFILNKTYRNKLIDKIKNKIKI